MLVQYKAYKSYGYDQRQKIFSQVNIFTLSANKIDVNHELVDYYDSHPEESILCTFGANQRIIKIARDQRLGSVGDDHIIVPISLTIKKYFNIPASEIEVFEQEVKEGGDTWSGSINNNGVSFGGEIRAILKNVGEDALLHPVVEDTYATAAAMGEENDDINSFTELYRFHEKGCNYWNCPVHFGDFRKLRYEKQWLLLGRSVNDPRVLKMGRLRRMQRLLDYSQVLSTSSQLMDATDAVDSPDYYENMS